MTPDIPRDVLVRSVLAVLKESVPGPDDYTFTWFDNNGPDAGAARALGRLTPAAASWSPGPGRRSIAAHAAHLTFGLRAHAAMVAKPVGADDPAFDWDRSWDPPAVTRATWDRQLAEMRAAHDDAARAVESVADWTEPQLSAAVGMIAHVAYHLGAIRQLIADEQAS